MDNINYSDKAVTRAGLPYDNIKWYNVEGQPFGSASRFNAIIFNDANNIVDIEGPVAIGGSFYSPRGLSVGYVRKGSKEVDYSPDLVRFLVGENVSMGGPLVVIGHVVGGNGFRVHKGSTYMIGKYGMDDEVQELKFLYQAGGGSQYWTPADKGDHYAVSSYDVPRYIPAGRISADVPRFFNDARKSIEDYKSCIEALTPNGTVIDNNHEWILRGDDPEQNVFLIDVRPKGLISRGIRAEVPHGSTVIVRLRTGAHAHLQYGLYGERDKANRTLYVFEDATDIHMEKSSDIWGSILAPQAIFHGHPTGGHVSGNIALGGLAVDANSGFEFHFYPFMGMVNCQTMIKPIPPVLPIIPAPEVPLPAPEIPRPLPEEVWPLPEVPQPTPEVPRPLPEEIQPNPECPSCPEAPACPEPEPCPICPVCPEPEPCPTCPACPEPEPCPTCPVCPEPEPCPVCPICPEPKPTPECQIQPGIIRGCISGCCCCEFHIWNVKLYERSNGVDNLLSCIKLEGYGYFEFTVPYEGCYILKVRAADPYRKSNKCKPMVVLNNVGVEGFVVK